MTNRIIRLDNKYPNFLLKIADYKKRIYLLKKWNKIK